MTEDSLKTLLFSISSPAEYRAIINEWLVTPVIGDNVSEADRIEALLEVARTVFWKFGMMKCMAELHYAGRLKLTIAEINVLISATLLNQEPLEEELKS